MKKTHGSLFSGIGAPELASEWIGWENLFHCEINDFCRSFLEKRFKSTSYADITTTDFNIWRGRVDILTGGFPCQDASKAKQTGGRGQLGLEGHRTGLWWRLMKSVPDGLSQKTLPISQELTTEEILQKSSIRFPDWGTMQNGRLCTLLTQVRPKEEPGVIWLLTPTASDYRRENLSSPMYAKRLSRSAGCLPEHLYRLGFRGLVNHRFVAWVMGFPIDHLNCMANLD
jgi:hypothetical protein